ncbi:MAG: hypothetical protein AAF226_19330, partial [Verrucomicrobiota bacterium]
DVIRTDQFGIPFRTTEYVEVESGRVTIELTDNLVTSINESEGIQMNPSSYLVPSPIMLF